MPEQGLQLDEHLAFQRRVCIAQRLGWAALAASVIAGALGLLGGEGFGPASLRSGDQSLRVDYPRWTRARAPMTVHVWMAPQAGTRHTHLEISHDYLDAMSLRHVQPAPRRTLVTPRGLQWSFAQQPDTPLRVRLEFEPRHAGPVELRMWNARAAVHARQWVHP